MKVYHNGFSWGLPPTKNDHNRSKRGDCSGWSPSASRNNRNFLYSVIFERLEEFTGYSFTLTIKTCPETSEDWKKLRERFLARLRRIGISRFHWVTEWQKRGVPHLHGCVWFKDWHNQQMDIINAWIQSAKEYEPLPYCQDSKRIETPRIWAEYLSKHAVRGHKNYQRSTPPEGWEKVGKVWGKGGDWPVREPLEINGSLETFHMFRRIVKRWRIAQARGTQREIYARKLFTTNCKNLSTVMGVSEWLPEEITIQILTHLKNSGCDFT